MTVHEQRIIPSSGYMHPVPGARIAVMQGSEPDDWRQIYDRLNQSSQRLTSVLVKGTAALATFFGIFSVAGGLALAILQYKPDISPHYLASAVILPGLLAGAALGHLGGNIFFRLWYRLSDSARRGFATRLSLGRCPREWTPQLKRWLFTGDWLGSPAYDLRLPYVRIYIEGQAPVSCSQEDCLWREIHGNIAGDRYWEAGTNIREISYPSQLPSWTRKVENGDGFSDLQKRIGTQEASTWIKHIWRRASRQWPALLASSDAPEHARRECFEMHSVGLAGGRNALVVVLRPTAFVVDTEEGEDKPHRLAA